jgi:hypothetical protein
MPDEPPEPWLDDSEPDAREPPAPVALLAARDALAGASAASAWAVAAANRRDATDVAGPGDPSWPRGWATTTEAGED